MDLNITAAHEKILSLCECHVGHLHAGSDVIEHMLVFLIHVFVIWHNNHQVYYTT